MTRNLFFFFQIIRPENFAVCNAVGAALCSVSATIDSMVDLLPSSVDGGEQRKRELDRLILKAHEQCIENGARSQSITLTDLEEVPLAYHPGGNKYRVQLTAIGQLDLNKFQRNNQMNQSKRTISEIKKEAPGDVKPPVHVDLRRKQPTFDENGTWIIDAIDIEYIAYGIGILG